MAMTVIVIYMCLLRREYDVFEVDVDTEGE